MKRHVVVGSALVVVGALALTSCSGSGSSGGGEGDGEITIWHTESTPATVEAMDEIIAGFEAENPGMTVTQESVAWGDLQVKLQAALAAGDMPELTHVEPMFVRTLYEQDLLAPVDGVVESFEGDYNPQFEEMFTQEDGSIYGVVHAWGVDLTASRADLYANAGVDPDQVKTWDDFREQLNAVTDANPGVAGLSLAGGVGHNVNEEVQMWLGSNGGSLFDEAGAPTIDTPEMKEVLEFWRSLKEDGVLDPGWSSALYADTLSNLAQGKAATIFSFGRATYTFEQQNPELATNGDIHITPTKPVGPSGDDWITQLDAEPWVAFKDASEPEGAQKFLEYFYQPENYIKWIGSVPTQLLPVRPSFFDDADYNALPEMANWRYWIDLQREVFDEGRTYPLMITNAGNLELPYVSDLYGSSILLDLVISVVEQGADVDEALADAQQRAEELLAGRY